MNYPNWPELRKTPKGWVLEYKQTHKFYRSEVKALNALLLLEWQICGYKWKY